jgi:hypothetical protein
MEWTAPAPGGHGQGVCLSTRCSRRLGHGYEKALALPKPFVAQDLAKMIGFGIGHGLAGMQRMKFIGILQACQRDPPPGEDGWAGKLPYTPP